MATDLDARLRSDIERSGYYPALVADALDTALAGEPLVSYLVHHEATFERDELRRHVTVLALTPTRLIVEHTDEHGIDETMREVSVTLKERAAVIPVELVLGWRLILYSLVAAVLLSLPGPDFSATQILRRVALAMTATGLGLACGTVLFPLLLPRMPRVFSVGGALLGLGGALLVPLAAPTAAWPALAGAGLWTITLSSWLALNFTGSTPYTSPSGVEREMRRFIPWMAGATALSAALFVWGNFL